MGGYLFLAIVCCLAQVLLASPGDDKFQPMVAFVCGKPAMHRGVNGWISDEDTRECWDDKRQILNYCRQMYPNHNVTNVVEAAYLVTIPGWPSLRRNALHTHRVRPFRCIVGAFQSDALLVPQHCKFDHKHDEKVCQGFSHWEVTARDACARDAGMHCESFGMLLNCGLGKFSGVEYVCCPDKVDIKMQPVPQPTHDSASASSSADDDDDDDDEPDNEESEDVDDEAAEDSSWESGESEELECSNSGEGSNLYELYLKGETMPSHLANEHQRFVAARRCMHKLQEAKNTQLMKEWTAARDHVSEVRKTDPKTAEKLSKEITERFQRLYNAYELDDDSQLQQIGALHQQHVQAEYNTHKRQAMDKYMRSLEKANAVRAGKNLRQYIRAEEKDMAHTVKHYSRLLQSNAPEATRIHAHVIQHLQLCQQRIQQALDMLTRYPDIDNAVRPQTEEFLKQFDDIALRIRDIVLPEPQAQDSQADSESSEEDFSPNQTQDSVPQQQQQQQEELPVSAQDSHDLDLSASDDLDDDLEEEMENEHDMDSAPNTFVAHAQRSQFRAQQGLRQSSSGGSSVGTTVGIAVGSVAVFAVLVAAVVMLRRRSSARSSVTHGYVEVDPAASPEERHVANMQMNGYENPTYRYFEVQTHQ